jgi:hypothetical protein
MTAAGAGAGAGPGAGDLQGAGDPGWLISDALVLAIVRITGTVERPASLMDLVAATDAMYHLILTAEMIEHAMSRLLPAALATVDDVGFAPTPQGRRLVAHARGRPGGDPGARIESLLRLLETVPVTPVPWALHRPTYDAVVLDYGHSLWQTFRAPGRRRP